MSDFWRRLLYRWFVQYNPLYLVSAMLVLGGTILTSRGLAADGGGDTSSVYAPLGVAAIAELYAVALIGGAALLTRIGQRRPAVMLALLTALYQCDLTLHTETCVQLGVAGIVAAIAWLVLFGGKLVALAWATKARVSRGAYALAMIGAAGLTAGPYVVEHTSSGISGAFIGAVLFVIAAVAPTALVTTTTELEPWAQTVFSRSVRAIWMLWGGLLALHVLFWVSGHRIALGAVLPAFAMICARRVRSEAVAWAIVGSALGATAICAPQAATFVALLATAALGLRAFSRVPVLREQATSADERPYRRGEIHDDLRGVKVTLVLEPLSAAARARYLAGALFTFYGALWSIGWNGHHWPAHSVAVDAIVLVLAIAIAFRVRPRLSLLVPALGGAHALAVSGLVPTPQTMLGWGGTALVLGFALLLGALATSYRLRSISLPDA